MHVSIIAEPSVWSDRSTCLLHDICYHLRGSNGRGMKTSHRNLFAQLPWRPYDPIFLTVTEIAQEPLDSTFFRVRCVQLELVIKWKFAHVDASISGELSKRSYDISMFHSLCVLGFCFPERTAKNRVDRRKELDCVWVATCSLGNIACGLNLISSLRRDEAAYIDSLGMLCGECLAYFGGSSLENDTASKKSTSAHTTTCTRRNLRSSLWRRMHLMSRVHFEVRPIVLDLRDPRWIVRNVSFLIPHDRVIGPRPIPEPIHDIHILFGNFIPLIMWNQRFSEGVSGSLRPTRNNIPCDAALCQVIERAEGTSEWEGRYIASTTSYSKRQRLRDGLSGNKSALVRGRCALWGILQPLRLL